MPTPSLRKMLRQLIYRLLWSRVRTCSAMVQVRTASEVNLLMRAHTANYWQTVLWIRIKTSEMFSMQSIWVLNQTVDRRMLRLICQVTTWERMKNAPFAHLLTLLRAQVSNKQQLPVWISTPNKETKIASSSLWVLVKESCWSVSKRNAKTRAVTNKNYVRFTMLTKMFVRMRR